MTEQKLQTILLAIQCVGEGKDLQEHIEQVLDKNTDPEDVAELINYVKPKLEQNLPFMIHHYWSVVYNTAVVWRIENSSN